MILFVDDETRLMDSYVEELKLSGYEVEFQPNVDKALAFFTKNHANIELMILDIMMPPGASFEGGDNIWGLRTGQYFYEKIRPMAPDLPVIILTNVSDELLAERFQQENNCWFLRKEDFLPFELVQQIRQILP
ncbi:MAG: response regulator [Planctomycetaceae bacterium]|nr:response regulator [Planctomycetaceae bacterium]